MTNNQLIYYLFIIITPTQKNKYNEKNNKIYLYTRKYFKLFIILALKKQNYVIYKYDDLEFLAKISLMAKIFINSTFK